MLAPRAPLREDGPEVPAAADAFATSPGACRVDACPQSALCSVEQVQPQGKKYSIVLPGRRSLLKEFGHLLRADTGNGLERLQRDGLLCQAGSNAPRGDVVGQGVVEALAIGVVEPVSQLLRIDRRQWRHEALTGHDLDPVHRCTRYI